ncbi:MAG: hypothetical protein KGH49_01945 [Candidatus Micrarchaeota archaeon]|nr:hypothetical protein [Candidatus Micrarchaeota archaeon]
MDPISAIMKHSVKLLYGIFASLLLASILLLSPIAIAACSISLLAAFAYSKSYHIINPILAKKHGIVLLCAGYALSENAKVAVKENDGAYSAVCVAFLSPNARVQHGEEKFEEILAKCRFPFEFSISVVERDTKKIFEDLQTKRRIKEIEISRTSLSKQDTLSRLKRELAIIEADLSSLASGRKPTEVTLKLKSAAMGASESQAANASFSQLEQLCSIFSAVYGLSWNIATGEELLASIGG